MKLIKQIGIFAASLLIIGNAIAAEANPHEAELNAAFAAAEKVQQLGPTNVKLAEQASIKLPAGFVFIPQPQAEQIMQAMGNTQNPSLLGLIFPTGGENWFSTVSFEKAGYIKDDDAKDWNADDLLTSLKEGTDASNEERKKRGFPELEIVGWVQKPNYDASAHHLLWSVATKDKQGSSSDQGINYNTYVLGREGYLSLDLITERNKIDGLKPTANTLLNSMSFENGKRYQDFNDSTDKVAEYGLAALITGVAAKKLGLLAIAGAFIVKFFKIILITCAGGFAAFSKLFRRKES